MKTEKEARECWCPFARDGEDANNRWYVIAHQDPKTGEQFPGRHESNPLACRCIASDCMAWEWEFEKVDPEATYTDQARGDCGLKRGKP